MTKVSDCCGASPYSNGDCDTEDFGICSQCGDHCEYVEEEEDEELTAEERKIQAESDKAENNIDKTILKRLENEKGTKVG